MSTNPPPIGPVTTIDEVISSIQSIIDWSITAPSRLGYFAALYKRITIAIKQAIAQNLFDNGPRMELFDVTFASRYFAAFNAYFYPTQYPPISHCWRVAFDAAQLPDPIIVQHLLAGVNAHIDLDLGIAAAEIAPGLQHESLHHDFNTVNAVLSSQVSTVVTEIDELSPILADLYAVLMKYELDLISDALVVVRNRAWAFSTRLAECPKFMHPSMITLHDLEVAKLGALILHPPAFLQDIVTTIASQESRDIAHNIEVLNAVAEVPAPMTKSAAAKI